MQKSVFVLNVFFCVRKKTTRNFVCFDWNAIDWILQYILLVKRIESNLPKETETQ